MSHKGDKAMSNESQWPEDKADWPQTASVVQGGVVPAKPKNQIIPKGSMCQGCSKLKQDCSHLNFANMPKIKKYPDSVVAVKCTEFEPVKPKSSLRGFGIEPDIQSGRVRNWAIGKDGVKQYL